MSEQRTNPAAGQTDDAALLHAFVGGDDAALSELARRYETALLGLARGLLGGDADLARDAVQETWMRVIRHSTTFRGRSTVKTWLYRIAINRCREMAKKAGRVASHQVAMQAGATESLGAIDDSAEQFDHESLKRAVTKLSGPKREVVLLCYHRDLTHEQAAAILQIPLGTLKSRLRLAMNDLRSAMGVEIPAPPGSTTQMVVTT